MPEEARRGSSLWVSWNEPDPTSIFKDLFIFILCVWVLCLHVLLRYHVGARYPQRPAEEQELQTVVSHQAGLNTDYGSWEGKNSLWSSRRVSPPAFAPLGS